MIYKKVFGPACILLAACFMSCADDDATYTPTESLDITSSAVLFEATGGSGSITTNSTGTLQAETTSTWVSLQVQGNKVTVDVPQNPSLDGRSAKISLKADGKESSIVVTQKGMVFEVVQKSFVLDSNAPATLQSAVNRMLTVTTETTDDWLQPVFNEQTGLLSISVTENGSGTARTGTVVVKSGEAVEHISVTQYDLTADIYGYYSFDYRTKEGEAQSLLAILQGTEMEILFSDNLSLFVPIEVDEDNHILTVKTPAYVGRYAGSYYTYLLVGHERAGSSSDQSTFTQVESPATLDAVQGQNGWLLQTSVFGGSWERYSSTTGELLDTVNVDMWIFDLMTGRVAISDDWEDKWAGFSLLKCCQPRLTKLSSADGEAWLSQYE